MTLIGMGVWAAENPKETVPVESGLNYTNYRVASIPWSIHVVQVVRTNRAFDLVSVHAGQRALGLSTVSAQVASVNPAIGTPVAAINGDFYQRDRAYAGDPRGLQVVGGEVISAPSGGVSFWTDALGEPHAGNVASRFQVVWPDGSATPVGLNGDRSPGALELFTPAIGESTRTVGGRELVLERDGNGPWLPLQLARTYSARVKEVRDAGDTPVAPGTLVLSVGPALAKTLPEVTAGAVLKLTTESLPSLRGVRTALSGGPLLVHNGRVQKIQAANGSGYESSSMLERHPRTAVGWNDTAYFLVVVDGRQDKLSVGMTLEELAGQMVRFGCQEALNLDGGGSATFWYLGTVRNRPCDGHERDVANALVVVRKPAQVGTQSAPVEH